MKVRCEYCNNLVDDGEEKCPGCGAVNKNYNRVAVEVPTTIAELEQWYKDRNLPPYETTRFFIGIDYKEPKAFGIYKDDKTGKFVVYKNKGDGERAIRYEGTDEKYAVNELYLKLKEEIAMRKSTGISTNNNRKLRSTSNVGLYITLGFIALCVICCMIGLMIPSNGYYDIDSNHYYKHGGSWYIYENDNWRSTSKPDYSGSLNDYYRSDIYDDDSEYSDIRESDVYDPSWDTTSSSFDDDDDDSGWDSSSNWDSGSSWDSSDTDWGSDW